MSNNELGTAYVVIRAITDKVRDDIKQSFRDAFKDVDADAKKAGERSGRAFGDGFRDGLKNSNLNTVLNTTFHQAESDAALAGDRAARAYANAYKQRMQQTLANLPTPVPLPGNGNPNNPNPPTPAPPTPVPPTPTPPTPAPPASPGRPRPNGPGGAPPLPPLPPLGGGGGPNGGGGGGGNGPDASNNSLRNLLATVRDLRRSINTLGDSTPFRAMQAAIGLVTGSLKMVIPIALAAGAALMALQGATGAIGGLLGGLTQVAAVLATLPALGVAAGAGIAAIVMGFSGIGGALKAMGAQAKEATKSAKDEAEKHRQALRAVASAANGVVTAQHSVKQAHIGVQDAQKNLIDTQKDLNQAYTDATRSLRDMNLELEGSKMSVEEAQYAVQDAALALYRTQTDPTATQLERQKADLNYRQSLLRLKQQKIATNDLAQDTAKANQAGIDGSERVVNAKDAEVKAQQQLSDAHFNLSQSIRGLAEAQQNLLDAQRKLNEGTEDAAGGVDKLKEAMDKLSPAGQDLVRKIYSLKDAWTEMKKDNQEALLSGWGDSFVKMANAQIPVLTTGLSTISTVINGIGKDMMGTFSDPERMNQWSDVLKDVAGMFYNLRPGFQDFLDGFLDLVNIGADYLPRMGIAVSNVGKNFREWAGDTEYVNQRIENAIVMWGHLWDVLAGLGGSWGAIFNTSATESMMDLLGDLALDMESFLKSFEGQAGIFTFFANAEEALRNTGQVIAPLWAGLVNLSTGLVQLGNAAAPGLGTFFEGLASGLDQLRSVMGGLGESAGNIAARFGPVVDMLGGELASAVDILRPTLERVGDTFARIFEAVGPLIPVFAELTTAIWGPLTTILNALVPLLEGVAWALESLQPILNILAPIIGVTVLALMGFLKTQAVIASTTLFLARLGTQAATTGAQAGAAAGGLRGLAAAAQGATGRVGGALGPVTRLTGSIRDLHTYTRQANPGMGNLGAAARVAGMPFAALNTSIRNTATAVRTANPGISTFGTSMRVMGAGAAAGFGAIGRGVGAATAALGGPMMIAFMAVISVAAMLVSGMDDVAKAEQQLADSAQAAASAQKEVNKALSESNGKVTGEVMAAMTDQVRSYREELKETAEAAPGFWSEAWTFMTATNPEQNERVDELQEMGKEAENTAAAMKKVGWSDEEVAAAMASTDGTWGQYLDQLRLTGEGGDAAAKAMQASRDALFDQREALDRVTPGMSSLQESMKILADETATAEDKANALRRALEALGVIKVDEARVRSEYGEAIREATQLTKADVVDSEATGSGMFLDGDKQTQLNLEGNANARSANEEVIKLGEAYRALAEQTGDAQAAYDQMLPAIHNVADVYGVQRENMEKLFKTMNGHPEIISTLVQLEGMTDVEVELTGISLMLDQLTNEGKPREMIVDGLSPDAKRKLEEDGKYVQDLGNGTWKISVDANIDPALTNISQVHRELRALQLAKSEPEIKAIIDDFMAGRNLTMQELQTLREQSATPSVRLLADEAIFKAQRLQDILEGKLNQEYQTRVKLSVEAHGANSPQAWAAVFGGTGNGANGGMSQQEYNRAMGKPLDAPLPGRAFGGAIFGPGGPKDDLIPAMLSNGEHVLTAEEVQKLGGQEEVYKLREAIMGGQVARFATGGAVGSAPGLGINLAGLGGTANSLLSGARNLPGVSGIADAWGKLTAGLADTTDKVISPVFQGVNTGLSLMGNMFQNQAGQVVVPTWQDMATNMAVLQNDVINPTIYAVGQAMTDTTTRMFTDITTIANPVWSAMSRHMGEVKTQGIDPTLTGIQQGVGVTVEAFRTGTDLIGQHFAKIQEKTHTPVKWTVDNVINAGVVGAWNSVAQTIGVEPLVPFTYMAEGGLVTGGTPDKDSVPTMLMPGEVVINKQAVQKVGADRLLSLNKSARAGANEAGWAPLASGPNDPNFKGGHAPRIPAFASGGIVQGGVEITSEIQRSMWDAVRTAFPNAILTSATRYADVGSGYDHHMGQRALDLAGPMPEIARWIYQMNRTMPVEELIHWPLNGWENLDGGVPFDFGSGTNAQHMDHVHWAMNQMVGSDGKLISMATGGGPAVARLNAVAQAMMAPILQQTQDQVGALRVPGAIGTLPPAMYATMRDALVKKVDEIALAMSPFSGGSVTPGTGPVVDQVKAEFAKYGWDQEPYWSAVDWIVNKESTWDPTAVNPSSGAFGLFQFNPMGGNTLGQYLPDRNPNPGVQGAAGAKYIKDRYGDPLAAKDHWERNGWYDLGGIIEPGITTVHNETGKPEALLNPDQWASVQESIKIATQIVDSEGVASAAKDIIAVAITAQAVTVNGPITQAASAITSTGTAAVQSALTAVPAPSTYTTDLPNTFGSTTPMGSDAAIVEAQLESAKADLEVARFEMQNGGTDNNNQQIQQDRITYLENEIRRLQDQKDSASQVSNANAAVSWANTQSQQTGSNSPEAQAAIANTMGAEEVNTGDFNNRSTDPNDPAFNNPYTDPALNASKPADMHQAWQTDFEAKGKKWYQDARAEVLDQFLNPFGLSTAKIDKMQEFAEMIGKQTALAMANQGIATINNDLGIENTPGLNATPGAPNMPGTVVFNGMDPQKAMEELNRMMTLGMQSISRFRS